MQQAIRSAAAMDSMEEESQEAHSVESMTSKCRGCMAQTIPGQFHSFSWAEIRELFQDCTTIAVPEVKEENIPHQICSQCYYFCEQWFTFKNMCLEVNQHFKSLAESVSLDTPTSVMKPLKEDHKDTDVAELSANKSLVPVVLVERMDQETIDYYTNPTQICIYCPRSFTTGDLLMEHLKGHTPTTIRECPKCSRIFDNRMQVVRHLAFVHQKGHKPQQVIVRYHCPICDKPLKTEEELKEHSFIHVAPGSKFCPICHKDYGRRGRALRHFRQVHGCVRTVIKVSKSPQTSIVPKTEPPESEDESMETTSTLPVITAVASIAEDLPPEDEKPKPKKKCPFCNKSFRFLAGHVRAVHIENNTCPYCSIRFSAGSKNGYHMRIHTKESYASCNDCHKEFYTPNEKHRHKGLCSKRFPEKSAPSLEPISKQAPLVEPISKRAAFRDAIVKIEQKEPEILEERCSDRPETTEEREEMCLARPKCLVCKKMFTSKAECRAHIQKTHKPRKGIPACYICGNTFDSKRQLLSHYAYRPRPGFVAWVEPSPVEVKQEPSALLNCSYCELQFQEWASLAEHVRSFHDCELFELQSSDCGVLPQDDHSLKFGLNPFALRASD